MTRIKKQNKRAVLVIEDGRTFQGTSFGAEGEALGEVVFNTSMTGYQEIICDPSYNGQIVTMTYPHIGNTGVNPTDIESSKIQVAGFVVRENSGYHSNWRATGSLDEYLHQAGVVGIEDLDTRALTLHIREKGAMKGIISTVDFNYESLMNKLYKFPGLVGRDLVKNVTTEKSYLYGPGAEPENPAAYYIYTPGAPGELQNRPAGGNHGKHYVVAIDCGIKFNILRILSFFDCTVIVVPASYGSAEILSLNPDGLFISNGPGDPEGVPYVIETLREILQVQPELPVFGICLGIQLLGLAFGGKTFKLKFGHRGANHPVLDLATGKIEITTQNHGFAVAGSKDAQGAWQIDNCPDLEVTHINLNDQTIEGFRHKSRPVYCVQYHPESSAGPHDSWYLFQRFIRHIEEHKAALVGSAAGAASA
ncbi:MAG: carbamoyl phosphate synthase small subunit [Candidatus Glassbacteria bacterium RIFCSPLOWO2_12_FULL_58_11]|uniref:Carbamoyl phosphate synthase small chain n=2 Tax=Candidatus Glassiibacteriota TaxID=1817805 RepID=A0A1F5YWJ2_9BACT|nr:MAG: carbamoyl phosphate synthase small subunit [Candidatus Glassbacteria bacterium GWA2_58_10]OGG04463.1 MAG: carbamoyl phosphate synthase small subunit [Candidatus Glassbacteria bacterium RIFCSPLOWO2_12_FULL_58_11]